jgi:hypothetical protein
MSSFLSFLNVSFDGELLEIYHLASSISIPFQNGVISVVKVEGAFREARWGVGILGSTPHALKLQSRNN